MTGKGLADHLLGLAVAVTRREIDQVDPGGDRGVHRGDAFVPGRCPPNHAEPAAPERQLGNRGKGAQILLLHRLPQSLRRNLTPTGRGYRSRQRRVAAILPPSTVVTSAVVFSATA